MNDNNTINTLKVEEYVPKIYGDRYVEMLLEGTKCFSCGKMMLRKPHNDNFPIYIHANQKSQMKRAGLVFISHSKIEEHPICIECEKEGKASFKCSLCNTEKPSNKLKESFGIIATDYLCIDCYESVSAKVWEEKNEEFQEVHKYDYE